MTEITTNDLLIIFNILNEHGIIKEDLCFDTEHFLSTVVIPKFNREQLKTMKIDRPYKNLTNSQIDNKIAEYDAKVKTTLKEAGTFVDYINLLNTCSKNSILLNAEKKIREVPTITLYTEFDLDRRIGFPEFIKLVNLGCYDNNDGVGYYADESGVTNIECSIRDITNNSFRLDMPYICWYEK